MTFPVVLLFVGIAGFVLGMLSGPGGAAGAGARCEMDDCDRPAAGRYRFGDEPGATVALCDDCRAQPGMPESTDEPEEDGM